MADDDLPSNIFGSNERENNPNPDLPQHIRLDLGDDSSRTPQVNRLGNQNSGNSGIYLEFFVCNLYKFVINLLHHS